MRRDRGWPIPPAAPKMVTFRSGADSDEKPRLDTYDDVLNDADELMLLRRTDLNIAAFILSVDLRADCKEKCVCVCVCVWKEKCINEQWDTENYLRVLRKLEGCEYRGVGPSSLSPLCNGHPFYHFLSTYSSLFSFHFLFMPLYLGLITSYNYSIITIL